MEIEGYDKLDQNGKKLVKKALIKLSNLIETHKCSSCGKGVDDEADVRWEYEVDKPMKVELKCEECGKIDKTEVKV